MKGQALLAIALVELLMGIPLRVDGHGQGHNGSSDQTTMNIAFDLPDLTATLETPTGTSQLEAFKSINNDQILRDTTGKRTSELFWVSVGLPNFVKTPDPRNQTIKRLFHFSNNGFNTYVEMMTASQRKALATTARTKYRVEISENQVVNLILSRFQCTLLLYDDVGGKYILNGKVSDFRNFPLRMDFVAPRRSHERQLFTESMEGGESTADLQFDCKMESSGKLMRTNTLMISADQQLQIGLEEKLFGPTGPGGANEVYVTRDQMTGLATEMYATLNIVEDYQMPEVQFREAFVEGLVAQVSSSAFAQVSVDVALASLSKYGFDIGADIQPDVIKRDIGKVLEIQTVGSKTRIILNETSYRQFVDNQSRSGGGKAGFFKLSASANWANANSKSSVSDDRSLSDQLRELNSASQEEAQWDVQGNVVRPKSLNVARLTRSRMSKTLTFSRIRIQSFNAPFQRSFAVYTLRSTISASFLEQLTERVVNLQNVTQQTRDELTKKTTDLGSRLTSMSGTVHQLSTTVAQRTSTVNGQIQQLGAAVQSARSELTAGIDAVASRSLRRCRICFREIEGSSQCQLNRNSCSGWSDAGAVWTQPFRDDTDRRAGGCQYQWIVECQV